MAEHFIIVSSGTEKSQKEENPENDIFYSCLNLHRYVKRLHEEFPEFYFFQIQNTPQLEITTKWSKPRKERQILKDITYRWNIQYDTVNLPVRQTQIVDSENRAVVVKGEEAGEGCSGRLLADVGLYLKCDKQ